MLFACMRPSAGNGSGDYRDKRRKYEMERKLYSRGGCDYILQKLINIKLMDIRVCPEIIFFFHRKF